jgi:putative intracellular protease/amidase
MKILMVLVSHDRLGDTGKKTGFWLEEFGAPYYAFEEAGAHLTLASPRGGQPPIDPRSELRNAQTLATIRFQQDKAARAALADTKVLSTIKGGRTTRRSWRRRPKQMSAREFTPQHTVDRIRLDSHSTWRRSSWPKITLKD